MIISGGENIASVEVEKALAAHPGVIEAAVVAVPDARWGERPVAFVTTADGEVTAQELTEFVRGRLAHFKAPDRVYFEALPKTSTGKIQKHVLRAVARSTDPGRSRLPGGRDVRACPGPMESIHYRHLAGQPQILSRGWGLW